ncbi:MAG: isoprenylcysteine carboxylmethyltransferase family protein [Desulfobaccales bacterium]|jgi:protein-S-isoprenylcysteine O-methyltransferase Ste14
MPEIDGIKEKNGEHPYGDAGQLILLGLFLIVWVADSFFLHLSTFLYLPWYIRLIFLVSCLAVAAFLFKSGHGVVSHSQRSGDMVTTGAFKYVRHPLYLGCILFYLGLALSTASLFSLVLWVAICIFYNYLASYEEKLLEAKFGEGYKIYKEQTGKWIPRMPFIYKDKDSAF